MSIIKAMCIGEILKRYPKTIKVFRKYRMDCLSCMGAEAETIESGAIMHGLDPEEIVQELNRAIGKKRSGS